MPASDHCTRKPRWFRFVKQRLMYFADPTAVIDSGSEIGPGTKIWHFSHVMAGSRIGRNCNLGQNVVISPGVRIGDRVKIQNNVSVYTGVELEDDVFCGPSMVFTNVINPRSHVERKHRVQRTLVKARRFDWGQCNDPLRSHSWPVLLCGRRRRGDKTFRTTHL